VKSTNHEAPHYAVLSILLLILPLSLKYLPHPGLSSSVITLDFLSEGDTSLTWFEFTDGCIKAGNYWSVWPHMMWLGVILLLS